MNERKKVKLCIIIPCFNEQEMLPFTHIKIEETLKNLMQEGLITNDSKVLFIDDGSKDKTWGLIEQAAEKLPFVSGIKLSNNFGHQSALLAGMFEAAPCFDCMITIDADLQDDVEVMKTMIQHFLDGDAIVYGVRAERKTDSFFKKNTAQSFYKLMGVLGVDIVYNHADYRLVSAAVVEALKQYEESNLFLRGIFPLMGFRSSIVHYNRLERAAGQTKYPLKKMISFAFNGITSFSGEPLRWVSYTGIIVFLISIILSVYAVYSWRVSGTVKGWTSIVIPMYFLGGIQLLCIGIMGEYLGKIYKEIKKRPRFLIEKKI